MNEVIAAIVGVFIGIFMMGAVQNELDNAELEVYKLNQCITGVPAELSSPEERCKAAVWMKGNQ